MERFTSIRCINGKPRKVIVGETGKIVNRDPIKEELVGLKKETHHTKNLKKFTDNELLEFLRKFYGENKRVPKSRDFDNSRYSEYPCSRTYKKRFGSWNNALTMAELQVSSFIGYADEELLGILIQFYEENGRSPMWEDFSNNRKYPSIKTYQRRFGSWNNALKMAELQVNQFRGLTDEKLLRYLVQFYEENGRSPTWNDFTNNSKYPGSTTYQLRFGSWQNALKLVELDTDSMVRKGVIETKQQKGRQAELHILENDEKGSRDLSGENSQNPVDGLSKDKTYDVKSCILLTDHWIFNLNKYVDTYYLVAYDKDRKNVLHKWRIPGNFAYGSVSVGIGGNYIHNIKNMKKI